MPGPAASEDIPPVLTVLRPESQAPFVLVCEHASNYIPPGYDRLGLAPSELERHIAYDIGAAEVTRVLSGLLEAPAFLAGRSRLLIDGNRPPGSPTSIPAISETTVIPANRDVTQEEAQDRAERYFFPFHDPLAAYLDARLAHGQSTRIVGVHSFTPVFHGVARPYHAGVLCRGASLRWGKALVAALSRSDRTVVVNEPYVIEDNGDYLVPVHAEPRGIEALLIEIRQDLITTTQGQQSWAEYLAAALERADHTAL